MTKANNERGEIPQNYQNDIEFIDPEDLIGFESSPELEEALAAHDGSQEESQPTQEQPEEQPSPSTKAAPISSSVPTLTQSSAPASAGFNKTPFAEEVAADYALKRREDTRGTLALIYTVSTFILFGIGMLIAVVDALMRSVSIIDNLKEVLPLISGIFLSSLGFVLGYYFRKGEGEDK